MRSTRMSRCNSPIPAMTVCPVSSSWRTVNVGSSSANFWIASESFSWSLFVFGSIATEITGSGKDIDSSTTWERSEEHTSELQSRGHLVCRLLLEKKNHTHEQ